MPLSQPSNRPLFSCDELDQQLDLLLHLLQFGDELLLVCGVDGVGKSTMLQRLTTRLGDGWCLCQLSGSSCRDVSQLFSLLADAFGFDFSRLASVDLLSHFQRHLQSIEGQQRPAVVVDDGDLLPPECLETLVHLSLLPGEGSSLMRVVVAGSSELERVLQRPPLAGLTLPRVIHMQPLDEEQSTAFIEYCQGHGVGVHAAMTAKQRKSIAKRAGGLPLQLEKMLEQQQEKSGSSSLIASWQFWVGMLSLVAFLALVLWPTAEEVPQDKTQDKIGKAATLDAKGYETQGDTLAPLNPLTPPTIRPLITQPSGHSMATAVIAPASPPSAADIPPSIKEEAVTAKRRLPLVVPMGAPAKEATSRALVSRRMPPDPITTPRIATTAASTIHTQEWLQSQPGSHYTIQLVASASAESLTAMVDELQLRGALARFTMVQQGRTLHVLTEGSYAERQQAEQAVGALPPTLKPWIRPIATIHQLLNKQPMALPLQAPATPIIADIKPAAVQPTSNWQMPLIRDTAWLWGQDPAMRTIQLIAARDRGAITDFVSQHRLHGDMAILESKRQGSPWFVLLLGRYQDQAAAKRAVAGLPTVLRNSVPWVRTFASVHDELSRISSQ